MRSGGNSHRRRSMYAALYWWCHEGYECVHIEVQVGSPWAIQRMEGCCTKGVGQASEAISYTWWWWVYLQEIRRIRKIRGNTKGNNYTLRFSVEWSHRTGELHDQGMLVMPAGGCRSLEGVLVFCSLSGSLSHEPHSDGIGSRQDSIRGLALWEDIFEQSPCVRMLRFCPQYNRETKEAGLLIHSRHIRSVQHIDDAVLRIQSIAQDASPLQRCGIQRREVVHSTECCRRSDL